jgi:hypothetical protein
MRIWIGATTAAVLVASGAGAAGAADITSRYTALDNCRDVAQGKEGEDWLLKRCPGVGKSPVWALYADTLYLRLGFGPRKNVSGTYAGARLPGWKIEWRGTGSGAAFNPFAVIVRVADPEPEGDVAKKPSRLVVFRLRADGTSCVIGEAKGAGDNARARAIADAARGKYACTEDPYLP